MRDTGIELHKVGKIQCRYTSGCSWWTDDPSALCLEHQYCTTCMLEGSDYTDHDWHRDPESHKICLGSELFECPNCKKAYWKRCSC